MTEDLKRSRIRLVILTAIALVAFAGNSVLCRLALKGDLIAADLFTVIRVGTGTLALALYLALQQKGREVWRQGDWRGAGFLALYMLAFSWAYLGLDTGPGALILFGAVQVTMVGWAAVQGERPSPLQLLGLVIALGGLVWLLIAPGTQAPPLGAAATMTAAGIGWAGYTLLGKGAKEPVQKTAGNFLKALPFVFIPLLLPRTSLMVTVEGVLLASASGVLASAAGYAIWYAVLRSLSSTRAAALQLLVPVLAAVGGLLFSGEELTLRLLLSSTLVLGGVGLVLRGKMASKSTDRVVLNDTEKK